MHGRGTGRRPLGPYLLFEQKVFVVGGISGEMFALCVPKVVWRMSFCSMACVLAALPIEGLRIIAACWSAIIDRISMRGMFSSELQANGSHLLVAKACKHHKHSHHKQYVRAGARVLEIHKTSNQVV